MQKTIFYLVFLLSSFLLSAQDFKFDINAGYLLATTRFQVDLIQLNIFTPNDPFIQNGDLDETNSESGFFIGLGGQLRFSEKVGLTGHINYASYAESSYLQIPVLLNYYLGDSGFNIQAGPQFSYIL
ncbi:hypothetical protein [Leeuwenhoekiella sp. W20_SRS_FM14]|uniref:hypothetical protein n=1 Tax=Leeuwenhoekiella sp. W20_SRS_FM14 TaxID=3240270 RepID=UPI003F99A321